MLNYFCKWKQRFLISFWRKDKTENIFVLFNTSNPEDFCLECTLSLLNRYSDLLLPQEKALELLFFSFLLLFNA